jgi:putative salt-induced outer membrane protein YdiY
MNIPEPVLHSVHRVHREHREHRERRGQRAVVVACSSFIASLVLFALPAPLAHAQPADATPYSEKAVAEPFQHDLTAANASVGASLNTGNTDSMQLNVGAGFQMVRGHHGLSLNMDFAYGRANLPNDMLERQVDTVRNLRTRGRYDLFMTPLDALFLAGSYRWDPFAGLDAREEGQVGYLRNFFKEDKHRFWGELGYDLTYDNYDPDPLPDPDNMGRFLKGHAYVHSGRLFLGYDNQINSEVQLLTGVEGLLNVEHPKDFRFNWDLALRSSIVSRLQVELKFSMQLDTEPVPNHRKVDAQTRANLIYTLI